MGILLLGIPLTFTFCSSEGGKYVGKWEVVDYETRNWTSVSEMDSTQKKNFKAYMEEGYYHWKSDGTYEWYMPGRFFQLKGGMEKIRGKWKISSDNKKVIKMKPRAYVDKWANGDSLLVKELNGDTMKVVDFLKDREVTLVKAK